MPCAKRRRDIDGRARRFSVRPRCRRGVLRAQRAAPRAVHAPRQSRATYGSSRSACLERAARRHRADEDPAGAHRRRHARDDFLGIHGAYRGHRRAPHLRGIPGLLISAIPSRRPLSRIRALAGRVRRHGSWRDRICVLPAPRAASETPPGRQCRASRRVHHPRNDRRPDADVFTRRRLARGRPAGIGGRGAVRVPRRGRGALTHRSAGRLDFLPRELVGARAAGPRVPELSPVFEASTRRHVALQRLLLEHELERRARRHASHEPRGRRRDVRRVRRGGSDLEKPARRLFVHRMRPLHRRLSREYHRQAAQPSQDRGQRAAAADGKRSARHRRPHGVPAADVRARRRCRRQGADSRRSDAASSARSVHLRRRALGLHELPRMRAGMSGVDRPARRHQ